MCTAYRANFLITNMATTVCISTFLGSAVGESATFTVGKDSSKAKNAINKFVEEFNDAQDYVKSLVSVTNDGENVTSGKFSSNIEISRLGSQLRKVVFGNSTPHSESGTTSDGADLIINDNTGGTGGTALANVKTQLQLGASNSGYVVKVLKDTTSDPSGEVKYYKFDGTNWAVSTPAFSSFRLSSLGLDFGIGSDRLQVKNSALLTEALEDEPEKVQALFAEETVESAFDLNSNTNRKYEGISYAVDDFITSFLSGDSGSGYKGAYNTHIESIRSQNKRLDERIEDYESYIEQREKTLSEGFMRMEEMQSKLNTQLQTLQKFIQEIMKASLLIILPLLVLVFPHAENSSRKRSWPELNLLFQLTCIQWKDFLLILIG